MSDPAWGDCGDFPAPGPCAHLLRKQYAERWVRFYSLPGGRRRPVNSQEMRDLLGRHNTLLRRLAGNSATLLLLTTVESPYDVPPRRIPILCARDPTAVHWQALPMPLWSAQFDPEAPWYWHIFISRHEWKPGALDPMLRLAAADRMRNTIITPAGAPWLFMPYDGGVDIICTDTAARDRLKSDFSPWLSDRPDGL